MQQNAEVARLMDVGELASLWRISPHTIRAWVRQKRLHPTKICRRLLFHPDECARFIAAANKKSGKSPDLRSTPARDEK
jgi:hypothetical protein